MAFTELELKRYEKQLGVFIEKIRPPIELRDKVDMAFRIVGQSIELFEIRAHWDNPAAKIEKPFAKATWTKTTKNWKIYWQRADLKWHRYEPDPDAEDVKAFLDIVVRDEFGGFFG